MLPKLVKKQEIPVDETMKRHALVLPGWMVGVFRTEDRGKEVSASEHDVTFCHCILSYCHYGVLDYERSVFAFQRFRLLF